MPVYLIINVFCVRISKLLDLKNSFHSFRCSQLCCFKLTHCKAATVFKCRDHINQSFLSLSKETT